MHPSELETVEHPLLRPPAPSDPAGVSVRWLGTAGYELTYDGTTILIDPYLTRVGLWRFLTQRIAPDAAAIDAVVTRADAVLVGHSHFDHVMDVPYIAAKTGATVYGSRSTANLMAASGLPEAQVVALDGARPTTFEVGPFRVQAIPSVHSTFALGGRVPYQGEIPCTCELPVRGKHYKCGDVLSYAITVGGRTFYHLGSANLVEDAIPSAEVDVLLVCIAARFATENFVARALKAVAPKLVVPMHYDNFFRGVDAPMKILPRTRFGRFVDDVEGFSREMSVRTLPLLGSVEVI